MSNKKYFTSDWHLFHKNVLNFCQRPFGNLEEMHETLIYNYNKTVPQDATCFFLGDISFQGWQQTKPIISQLNGFKVLIRGNHDKSTECCLQSGFDLVFDHCSIDLRGFYVSLSHFPLRGIKRENTDGMRGLIPGENWYGELREKNQRFIRDDIGQFHLHGHQHSPNKGRSTKILGKQYDVGVDANNFTPVSDTEILSWILTSLAKEGYNV